MFYYSKSVVGFKLNMLQGYKIDTWLICVLVKQVQSLNTKYYWSNLMVSVYFIS